MIKKLIAYVREVKVELSRVNWPTRKQTVNYTMLVIILSIVMALFLGGLDYLFGYILKSFIAR